MIRKNAMLWSLLCFMPIIGMSVDVITPSLPAMTTGLQTSAEAIKTSIALYLIGYMLGNFLTGFLSDAWGRYKLLHAGILSFILSSFLPFLLPQIGLVLVVRLLQGIASGGIATAIRAIFTDILPSEQITRMGTLIGTMWGIGPVIGPVIGGYLQFYFGWQACFLFLGCIGLLVYIPIFFLVPETHFHRHPLHIKTIGKNIREVLSHKEFVGLCIIMGSVYSLIISFHVLAPFLIETKLHYSPVFFGHLALWMGIAFFIATIISRHLLKHHSSEKLFLFFIHLFMGLALVGSIASLWAYDNIWFIACISGLMFYCTGSLFPMSMGKGMSHFKHIAGTASAVMYLLNIALTSFSSFVLSFLNIYSAFSLIMVYCVLLAICVLAYWGLIREVRIKF